MREIAHCIISLLVDNQGHVAADIALSLNNAECYRTVRDAGIRTEFIHCFLESRNAQPDALVLRSEEQTAAGSTDEFLKTRLKYSKDERGQEICLASLGDGEEVGVMMGWEQEISRFFFLSVYLTVDGRSQVQKTVELLYEPFKVQSVGVKVLNIGSGLGIVCRFFGTADANHSFIEI